MDRYGWLLWGMLAVACGGKSSGDGVPVGTAGQPGGAAGAGSGGASGAGNPGAGCAGVGNHRSAPTTCSTTRAAGLATPNSSCQSADGGVCPGQGCSQDSDCVEGKNGRCLLQLPNPYACSYDTCFADADCAKGSVCQCRVPANGVDANYCTPLGNCRVDADCGVNGFCSPSQAHEWCGAFYACHTPDDACVNDSDCGGDSHCDYDTKAKRWLCGNLCGGAPL